MINQPSQNKPRRLINLTKTNIGIIGKHRRSIIFYHQMVLAPG